MAALAEAIHVIVQGARPSVEDVDAESGLGIKCMLCSQRMHKVYIMQSRGTSMATLTIRKIDPVVKERLRVRAARHGRSMEAEARRILQAALGDAGMPLGRSLSERIHARFAPLGGVEDLELPSRDAVREPPCFD